MIPHSPIVEKIVRPGWAGQDASMRSSTGENDKRFADGSTPRALAVRALGDAAAVGAVIGGAVALNLAFGGGDIAVGRFDRLMMAATVVAAYLLGTVILALPLTLSVLLGARWAVLPASLAGGWIAARWARALWGSAHDEWVGALMALLLALGLALRHRFGQTSPRAPLRLLVAVVLSALQLGLAALTRPEALDARTPEMRRAERASGSLRQDIRPAPPPSTEVLPGPKPRNVIVIVIDTLRADHLSAYGYPLETTPSLDRIADEGMLFESHWVQRPKTSPSVASILTGRYPHAHRVLKVRSRLPEEAMTLAEVVQSHGMQTAGFVANPNLFEIFNFHQGFDSYSEIGSWKGDNHAAIVNQSAMRWLETRHEEPFFAYIHYIDPHTPYDPPKEYKGRFEGLPYYERFAAIDVSIGTKNIGSIPHKIAIENLSTDVGLYVARYDEEIAYVDREIGKLMRFLEDLGRRDDTLLIVTSDHGETMAERGVFFNHGLFATENQVHVPLIMSFPPWSSGRKTIDVPTESIDIFPTVLDALALPKPSGIDGRSMLPLMREPARAEEQRGNRVFAEAGQSRTRFVGAMREGRWKVHYRPRGYDATRDFFSPRLLLRPKKVLGFLRALREGRGDIRRWELYDLEADPFETNDLLHEYPDLAARLADDLLEWLSLGDGDRVGQVEIDTLSEDLAEKLRGLGYVQ